MAAGTKAAFEVAAVTKAQPNVFRSPGFPLDDSDAYASTGGRFSAIVPLSALITFAYKLHPTTDQRRLMFAKAPGWIETDRFEIQAKAPLENPSKDQMRLMLQSLLAERFQLAVHFEVETTAVFELVLSKLGQTGRQLRSHSDGPPCDQAPLRDVFPPACGPLMLQSRPSGVRAGSRDSTMAQLATSLADIGKLNRPVVDRTGLTGRFDFAFEWESSSGIGVIPNKDPRAAAEDEANFMHALEDQLGLKLRPSRAPIQTLAVDRVEWPTGN
jgi:uncharacterized protein (TIGR03435 family)